MAAHLGQVPTISFMITCRHLNGNESISKVRFLFFLFDVGFSAFMFINVLYNLYYQQLMAYFFKTCNYNLTILLLTEKILRH